MIVRFCIRDRSCLLMCQNRELTILVCLKKPSRCFQKMSCQKNLLLRKNLQEEYILLVLELLFLNELLLDEIVEENQELFQGGIIIRKFQMDSLLVSVRGMLLLNLLGCLMRMVIEVLEEMQETGILMLKRLDIKLVRLQELVQLLYIVHLGVLLDMLEL